MNSSNQSTTISEMLLQGLTPVEISETLQLPLKDVVGVLEKSGEVENLDALYAKYQVSAVKILNRVMIESENDSARVSAAKVLLNRGGNFSEDTMNRLTDRFSRMRIVCGKRTVICDTVMTENKEVLNVGE